jgi:capsular exopolysaccharide synthesis family protein
MSSTYEALKKAEIASEMKRKSSVKNASTNGSKAPEIYWDSEGPGVEYERIGVWLTNPMSRGQRLQTVMIVSPHSGTGSTTTAALLAHTLAKVKKRRVLIIDSNFRTPALNMVFQVKNNVGFTEVASEVVPLEAHIQPTNRENLFVLTCGQLSTPPIEVFESELIDQLIAQLKERFDFIIFDAAPIVEFPDAFALASKVDSIILVAQSERTSIEDAQRAKFSLERAGGRILGVVLNRQTDYTPSFLKRLSGVFC